MDKEFKPDIRPLRGTIYTVLAAPLALFGLFALFHAPLEAGLFISLWCGVCAALLGWRAWANLTGSGDMREIGKPATGALLTLVAGGRILMALVQMRIGLLQRQEWILWLAGVAVLAVAVVVFRRVQKAGAARGVQAVTGSRS